eukprot:526023_1
MQIIFFAAIVLNVGDPNLVPCAVSALVYHQFNRESPSIGLSIHCTSCGRNEENNDTNTLCTWTGELNGFQSHREGDCVLSVVVCLHCGDGIKRYKSINHDMECRMKPIQCVLLCGALVTRHAMDKHIVNDCIMAATQCSECKEEVLRQDMDDHPCNTVKCPYAKYGCNMKIKQWDMPMGMTQHLTSRHENDTICRKPIYRRPRRGPPPLYESSRSENGSTTVYDDVIYNADLVDEHKESDMYPRYRRQRRRSPPLDERAQHSRADRRDNYKGDCW